MNYIREINAFYNELEINPLSSSAIALWHALLHINNRAGWKDRFDVRVGTLSLKSGLSDRTISNARNELKTKGFIDFTSRKGRQSCVYQMKCLSANIAYNNADNVSDNPSDLGSGNASASFKRSSNETKRTSSTARKQLIVPTSNEKRTDEQLREYLTTLSKLDKLNLTDQQIDEEITHFREEERQLMQSERTH